MDKLLTVKDLSAFLGMHPNTIYKMVKKGEIPFIKIKGVGIRFREEEIKAWLEEGSNKASQISELLPKFDISLESYDKILLKRRTELKDQTKWTYGIGSVILRKTKNKEDRYYIHYQIDKHRVRKAVKGARTRAEAVKALNAEVADILRGRYNFKKENPEITFNDMADLYLEKYSKPNKRSWKSSDSVYIRNMKPFFGNVELSKVTPLMIEEYKIERLKQGVKKKGATKKKLENSSLNRELSCLRKIFNVAIDWGYANDNPVRKVKFFSENCNLRERVLTEEEEKQLFEAATPHLKPILAVALFTGMRRGEVLKLKWQHVDFEKREIIVVESKSGKARTLPINSFLFHLLYCLRLQDGKSEFVFANPETGKPFVDIKRAFNGACERVGIKDLRFHDLRHTFASRLARNGVDLNTVKELMGHASITTTQRYLHSQAKEKRQAVEGLAGQAKKFDLECQKNDKSATADVETEIATPSYLGS
jgi:excisionase family DNA binding protein